VWSGCPAVHILLVVLTANGVYLGNSTIMYSGWEFIPSRSRPPIMRLLGMGLGLMVEVRLNRRYFQQDPAALGITMMLLMNCINMSPTVCTDDRGLPDSRLHEDDT